MLRLDCTKMYLNVYRCLRLQLAEPGIVTSGKGLTIFGCFEPSRLGK